MITRLGHGTKGEGARTESRATPTIHNALTPFSPPHFQDRAGHILNFLRAKAPETILPPKATHLGVGVHRALGILLPHELCGIQRLSVGRVGAGRGGSTIG
jgi:hypothetical protein